MWPLILFYLQLGFALWSIAYFLVLKTIRLNHLDRAIIYTTFVVVALLALLTFPVYSQDQNWNLLMSKGFVRYGINPYLTPLGEIPANSWFSFVPDWHNIVMTHGPLSVYIYSIPVLLSDNFYYCLLFLKLISLASLICCFILFSKIMHLAGVKDNIVSKNLYFLLLNPFLIVNSVVTVHNDIFVGLAILLFVLFLLKRRYILCSLMLFAGALVKYIPLILIPLLLYKIWTDKELSLKNRAVKSLVGLFLGTLVSFLLYLPFFEGSKNITALLVGLRNQYNFDIISRGVFTSFILYRMGLYGVYLRVFSLLSAVIISIYLAYRRKVLESVYITLMIPVFFGNLWFQPWYLLWSYFLLAKKELSYGLLFLTIFLELIIINSNVLRTSTYVFALFLYVMSARYLIKFVRKRRKINVYV